MRPPGSSQADNAGSIPITPRVGPSASLWRPESVTVTQMNLAPRQGQRPTTSTEGPQRQLDQHASPELWGLLVAGALRFPHVIEGHSQVSPAATRALLFDDLREPLADSTSLAPRPPLEPAHIHGVTDTSSHLCLPPARAVEVCDLGWAEPHQYADHPTEVMLYAPRHRDELAIVLTLLQESLSFARDPETGQPACD